MPKSNIATIEWADQASFNYFKTINQILDKFSDKEVNAFIDIVESTTKNIARYEHICPKSKKKKLHRCIIHPNASLIYTIKKETLYIVDIIDNRSNHKY